MRLFLILVMTFFYSMIVQSMVTVNIFDINSDTNVKVGHVSFKDRDYGLLVQPNLKSLPPGLHGFHIHVNNDCGSSVKDGKQIAGLAAGGHFDPANTGQHLGPYHNGHLGDLPALYVNEQGIAYQTVLAPRLKESDITGHSIMVHAGGDNYSDSPSALGGGGMRMYCGVS